jgi:hypothetical protein
MGSPDASPPEIYPLGRSDPIVGWPPRKIFGYAAGSVEFPFRSQCNLEGVIQSVENCVHGLRALLKRQNACHLCFKSAVA